MGVREFFGVQMRREVAAKVGAIEERTRAEVVVCVRPWCSEYAEARGRAGAILALAALGVLLFAPQEFSVRAMPVHVAIAYVVGALLARWSPPLRRALTRSSERARAVELAASAHFFDRRLGATARQTAVLVYVGALEQRVGLRFDVGLDPSSAQGAIREAEARLADATARLDRRAFVEALGALGDALATIAPAGADDVDELPNEVDA
jgi:putative membrane protein